MKERILNSCFTLIKYQRAQSTRCSFIDADGVVKEVSDNGVVLENKDGLQIVNLEYVLKVREYPYKNGKRVLILDE